MLEFEKDTSPGGSHTIESNQVLCDAETGRVVAVFYNDYDLAVVIELQAKLKEAEAKLAQAEVALSWAVVPEGARI